MIFLLNSNIILIEQVLVRVSQHVSCHIKHHTSHVFQSLSPKIDMAWSFSIVVNIPIQIRSFRSFSYILHVRIPALFYIF